MSEFQSLLDQVGTEIRKYDAENDIIPGTPMITHADYVSLIVLGNLLKIIQTQDVRIKNLESLHSDSGCGK